MSDKVPLDKTNYLSTNDWCGNHDSQISYKTKTLQREDKELKFPISKILRTVMSSSGTGFIASPFNRLWSPYLFLQCNNHLLTLPPPLKEYHTSKLIFGSSMHVWLNREVFHNLFNLEICCFYFRPDEVLVCLQAWLIFSPHTSWSNKLPLPNNLVLAMSLDHTQLNTIMLLQTCIKPW